MRNREELHASKSSAHGAPPLSYIKPEMRRDPEFDCAVLVLLQRFSLLLLNPVAGWLFRRTSLSFKV